jgi:hypothetical protein
MAEQICPICGTPATRGASICPVCASALPIRTQVHAPVYPPPPAHNQPVLYDAPTHVVVVGTAKDPTTAALLGFFLGPLGLLYSTLPGAAIMFGASVVVGLLTFGLGLFVLWPVSAVVGYRAAKSSNERVTFAADGYGFPAESAYIPLVAHPAGWYSDPHGQATTRYWDGASWTMHTN